MTTDRKLMQQALDALEYVIQSVGGNAPESFDVWFQKTQVPAEALRARLAQPEQPQIVWIDNKQTGNFLNMAMPQREWQGLTDEEIESTVDEIAIDAEDKVLYPMGSFARAIERALKEKNHG